MIVKICGRYLETSEVVEIGNIFSDNDKFWFDVYFKSIESTKFDFYLSDYKSISKDELEQYIYEIQDKLAYYVNNCIIPLKTENEINLKKKINNNN